MYIKDGIAYAGEIKKPLKVNGVRPMDNYMLWLRFSNGESRIFDFKKLIETPAFSALKDTSVFNAVYIDYGCPVWSDGEIDIDPEYLYEMSQVV